MGLGSSQEEAAVNFLYELIRQFPKDNGLYSFMLRRSPTYEIDRCFLTGKDKHQYSLRGSYLLEKKAVEDTFAGPFRHDE